MQIYFDKNGNLYQIDDVKKLKKKDTIEVCNEAGEEFSLPVKNADEFKLTADEKVQVTNEIKTKIMTLAKTIGLGEIVGPAVSGGCPNIDPPDLDSIHGTRINTTTIALNNLLKAVLGGGCPNIDPINPGSILGTIGNPQYHELAKALNTNIAACPNIDPPDIGSIAGTRVNPQLQVMTNLLRVALGGGCGHIDPPDLSSILGTRINPQQQLAAGLLRAMLGNG